MANLQQVGVEAVVKGLSQFEAGMNKMNVSVQDVGKNVTKSTASITQGLQALAAGTTAGIAVAASVAYGAKQAFDATVGATVKYADQVRSLTVLIGASAEESSKLVQAADDTFISFDTLSTAMEGAIRKGYSPTIAGLGKIADAYNGIKDPIERAKFLMDTFGRSGADMAPLLARGSDGIAQLGRDAEATGLVLSGKTLAATLAYKQQLDSLNDQFEGLKITIGQAAIPAVVVFGQVMIRAKDAFLSALGEMKLGKNVFDLGQAFDTQYLNIWAAQAGNAAHETGFVKNAMEGAKGVVTSLADDVRSQGDAWGFLGGRVRDANAAFDASAMSVINTVLAGQQLKVTEQDVLLAQKELYDQGIINPSSVTILGQVNRDIAAWRANLAGGKEDMVNMGKPQGFGAPSGQERPTVQYGVDPVTDQAWRAFWNAQVTDAGKVKATIDGIGSSLAKLPTVTHLKVITDYFETQHGTAEFQHGGQFIVGGSGGPDSQTVHFRASPGELVTVTPQVGGRVDQRKIDVGGVNINSKMGFDAFDAAMRQWMGQ